MVMQREIITGIKRYPVFGFILSDISKKYFENPAYLYIVNVFLSASTSIVVTVSFGINGQHGR